MNLEEALIVLIEWETNPANKETKYSMMETKVLKG